MIRIAAVGDLHLGLESKGAYREHLEHAAERADVFILTGDLTKCGDAPEASVFADEFRDPPIPVVAVLGNHDYHASQADTVHKTLEDAGLIVLEGESTVLDLGGTRVGFAGTKGFGGGFAGACGTDFGEPEMKAFAKHTRGIAERLEDRLRGLDAEVKIAVLHYSPVRDTLEGEPLEIYPFLGSFLLAEAVDEAGADLVLHGHAHRGIEKGLTPGGVHVRNVAAPVIRHAYNLYCVGPSGAGEVPCEPADAMSS